MRFERARAHAGMLTPTQNVQYLLLFQVNNFFANAPLCSYVRLVMITSRQILGYQLKHMTGPFRILLFDYSKIILSLDRVCS
jgi:hypothetical protein